MASTATNADAQADAKYDDYTAIFSATASTSGVQTIQVERGYLTELIVRIDGDLAAGSLTGGPVKIEAYIKRQMMIRHLCGGAIQNEMQVKGSGQIWIPSRSDIVIKWTNLSATAVVVRASPIVSKQAQGDSAPGWTDETLRPIGYVYQARRVATNGNAAAGATIVDLAVPSGVTARICHAYCALAAANSAASCDIVDEDNAQEAEVAEVAAGANRRFSLPVIGTGNSHANAPSSDCSHFYIAPGQKLAFSGSNQAQTETLTLGITLLMSDAQAPTWSKARSANEADVTLAASTISDANTWQAVYPP